MIQWCSWLMYVIINDPVMFMIDVCNNKLSSDVHDWCM